MSKKIFITRKIPEIGVQKLIDNGYTVDIYPADNIPTQNEIINCLKKESYDGVLCLLTDKIDAAVFDAAPSVKIYANFATGFDNIDVSEAKKRGIITTNAPTDLSAESVAEHALALMFALATRIVEADKFIRLGKYKGWDPMSFIGTNLLDKTLGIVGGGRIGAKVAHYSRVLGLKIIYTDIAQNKQMEEESQAVYISSIEELLPQSDIVSLHVPLMDSTKHLINESRLSLMKPTSLLINTSRGPIVDERALEKALKEGVITAAALDVFEFEPQITPGLIELDNIILTPHIASASIEARNQMAEVAADNIIDFFEGRTPRNNINQ